MCTALQNTALQSYSYRRARASLCVIIRAEFAAGITPSLDVYSLLRRQQILWLVHSQLSVFVRTDLRACRIETHKHTRRLPCPHRIPYPKHTRWHILTRAALHLFESCWHDSGEEVGVASVVGVVRVCEGYWGVMFACRELEG